MTMTPSEAQMQVANDICWASLRDCQEDITRIGFEGPSRDIDGILIRAVFMAVLGELLLREYQSENPKDDGR